MPKQHLTYDEDGAIIVPTGVNPEIDPVISMPDARAMQPKPTAADIALAPYKARRRRLEQQGKIDEIREFTRTRFRDPVDVVLEEDPELPAETDLESRPESPWEG